MDYYEHSFFLAHNINDAKDDDDYNDELHRVFGV